MLTEAISAHSEFHPTDNQSRIEQAYYHDSGSTELQVDEILDAPGTFIADQNALQKVLILDEGNQWYQLTATKETSYGNTTRDPQPAPREQVQFF